MSRAFQVHWDILPEAQRRLWPKLRPTVQLGLVLYGGTAIALRLGHRSSVAFDFFTDQALDRIAIHTACPFLDRSPVLQDQPDTLTVVVPCGDSCDFPVKVSFFGAIGFGRVGEPELTDDQVLQVASPDDLMAAKLKVVQGFEGGPNSHVVGTSPRTMKVDTFMATSDRLNAFLSEAPS